MAVKHTVKLGKLAKTLRRDLAANPMKAGVLGVLLLGGTYFWGPLVWKWVAKKESPSKPSAAVVTDAAQVVDSNPGGREELFSGEAKIQETQIAWQEIRKRRETDPQAHSAEYRAEWDQVFQGASVTPLVQPSLEPESKQIEAFDPRNLGLVLQGVFIGTKSKKAIISGKIYCERDVIPVSQIPSAANNQAGQPENEIRVVQISRKHVELERAGRIWQLKLAATDGVKLNQDRINPGMNVSNEQRDERSDLRDGQ